MTPGFSDTIAEIFDCMVQYQKNEIQGHIRILSLLTRMPTGSEFSATQSESEAELAIAKVRWP